MRHSSRSFVFISGAAVVLTVVLLLGWQPNAGAASAPITTTPTDVPSASSQVNQDLCNSGRSVNVSGSAAVQVIPDRVVIQLGVVSNDTRPERVQEKNTAAIKNVVDAIRRLGVAEKNIATDRYIVRPVYDDYDSLHIVGYRIDNMVSVTLEDVDKTGDVLVAALKAGANQVREVEFYTSELRRYRDEARQLAMVAASEKAQALAEASGAQVGCVLQINENSWSYYNGMWGGGRDQSMWTQNVVQNLTGDQGSIPDELPVSVGKIVVQAQVTASYSLH